MRCNKVSVDLPGLVRNQRRAHAGFVSLTSYNVCCMDLAEQAEKTLIAADMRLYLDAMTDSRFRHIQSETAMALMPFFSSFLLDSYRYMQRKAPEQTKTIRPNEEIMKNSRLRLKPLELNGKDFEDILEDTSELARINSEWFKQLNPRLLRPLYRLMGKEYDLGTFFVDGEIVSTTDVALMNFGITENLIAERSLSLHNLGAFMLNASTEYGEYTKGLFGVLLDEISDVNDLREDYRDQILALIEAFELVWSGEHRDDSRVDESLSAPYRDLRSEVFYGQIAKGRGREQTAAFILLLTAWTQVNAARVLIPKVSASNHLAALKVRFLSLYHAAHTLDTLAKRSYTSNLVHTEARDLIGGALGNKYVRKIRKKKDLRNTLIHYAIPDSVVPRLSENLPLSRLVEAHPKGGSLAELWNDVSAGLDHISRTLGALLPDGVAPTARVH